MSNKQLNLDNIDTPSNTNNSSHEFSQIIQRFNKMNIKEIEPATKNINKNIFDGDLNTVTDELVNLIFKELNEGKYTRFIKQNVLDYINDQKIILYEIFDWLLNDQNSSNSIYLLGYFNY